MVHLVFAWLILFGVFIFAGPSPCPGCFAEPESPMNQGVHAGVLVLLGVVGLVLTALATVLLSWMRRAAKLEANSIVPRTPAC